VPANQSRCQEPIRATGNGNPDPQGRPGRGRRRSDQDQPISANATGGAVNGADVLCLYPVLRVMMAAIHWPVVVPVAA
jgi:hypothetical protein